MNPSSASSGPQPQPTAVKSSKKPQDFGRIDADGNVWVKDNGTERMVGGYPDGVPEDPFALYVRRFLDLEATINLFEARLPGLSARDIDSTLSVLHDQLAEPSAVGDLQGLRDRVEALNDLAKERKVQIGQERAAAKEEALAARNAVVDEAEKIAGQRIESTQWKQSGQRLRELLDSWKEMQRKGPRLEKAMEDSLWKRFSSARTTFDRNRRQYFAALDDSQAQAKAMKEELIAQAVKLQDSEDWGATSGAYRDLMDRWKRAGRASRKEDDALWVRFRAAQQVFFDRRRTNDQANETAFSTNLQAKESLVKEAEALLPIEELAVAKEKLRDIQDRWEEIGRVAARDVSRTESKLRAVEKALRDAEEREWKQSNPETQARAQGMQDQLKDQITELEEEMAAATAAGDKKKASDIEDTLATKRAWLAMVSESIN